MTAPATAPPHAALLALDAVVVDTETTGLDARKARIVQIGAVRLAAGAIDRAATFDQLVNPGAPIPAETVRVHGVTDAMVADAPRFPAVAPEFEAFAGAHLIIGHTIGYDIAVLKSEYSLAGRAWPPFRTLDLRDLARVAAPGLADHGLDRLCEWLDVKNRKRHSALGDALATAELFIKLFPLLHQRGIRTLGEAEAAIRALAEADAAAKGSIAVASGGQQNVSPLLRIDSFPYRHTIADVMSRPAETLAQSASLRDCIGLLLERKISSVLVQLDGGEMGLVTERDALRAIGRGGGAALDQPIGPIASRPLQTIAESAFVYRAIGRIERLGLRHLAVVDAGGAITGVVTTRNLLRHRATTAIALGDEIDHAATPAALAAAWAKLPLVARSLISEEVDPRTIAAVVSSEIRAMTARAAVLAESKLIGDGLGPPPLPYAVLVLGSAGRGESQLAADQDNAIVYADGADPAAVDRYFEMLAIEMSRILDLAGIPLCKGGVMASNRAWRKSVSEWHATIDGWVRHQTPQDLLAVDIFFDAVGVHGDPSLADDIWQHAYNRGSASVDFVKMLTESARTRTRPFSMFGNLRVDAKGRFDVKKTGLLPLFTAARVLSIRHGVRARATSDRLAGVVAHGVGSAETLAALIAAQRTLFGAVIDQQLADLDAGVPPTPTVVPSRLDSAAKSRLKQALQDVARALDLVSEGRL